MSSAALALGGGPLGDPTRSDQDALEVLERAYQGGVRLVDTAPSYGESERRIGRFAARCPAMRIATKVGYGVEGAPDWSPRCITEGVEQARRRLQRDVLDMVLLHSCPLETMRGTGVLEALLDAKATGRAGAVGYSGQGEALSWVLQTGAVEVVQTSVNVVDWEGLQQVATQARRPTSLMAKRPLASAAFSAAAADGGPDRRTYRERWMTLRLDELIDPAEAPQVLLRWTRSQPGVDYVLVGTSSPAHLEDALAAWSAPALEDGLREALDQRYREAGDAWPGVV